MTKICFRFDVDTHKCARVGIPRLVELADKHSVKFTFFVNPGRAIHPLRSSLARLTASTSEDAAESAQLGALRKFGTAEYLRCALLNPRVARYGEHAIRHAFDEGHEIGLHGGRNHETWARQAAAWSPSKVRAEVSWGLRQLGVLGIRPNGFASPCAVTPPGLDMILKDLGFAYYSDDLAPASVGGRGSGEIPNLATALCGDGGIAYIENGVAKGLSSDAIVEKFKRDVSQRTWSVLYDHPYFAGDEALPITESLVKAALDLGAEFVTLGALA